MLNVSGSFDPHSNMIVTNALYFKSTWEHGFNPRLTRGACFLKNGVCRNVAMMDLRAQLNYSYVENLRAHAVELPYKVCNDTHKCMSICN